MLNNVLMNFMAGIANLGAVISEDDLPTTWKWVATVANTIFDILWPLLIIVGAAGAIWAVVLGVNMARADSTEKREEAKKRLLSLVIGLAITIGLILFFILFIQVILPAFFTTDNIRPEESVQEGMINALNMFRLK